MEQVLRWLHGKKSIFFTIAGLIVNYLVAEGVVSPNLSVLIGGIMVALGGTADVLTVKNFGLTKK